MHSGSTINSGHYYSHILSRDGSHERGKWFSFNDEFVSAFSPADIPDQAFGGAKSQPTCVNGQLVDVQIPLSHCGYILFYERIEPYRQMGQWDPELELTKNVEELALEHLNQRRVLDPNLFEFLQTSMPSNLSLMKVTVHRFLRGDVWAARTITADADYSALAEVLAAQLQEQQELADEFCADLDLKRLLFLFVYRQFCAFISLR